MFKQNLPPELKNVKLGKCKIAFELNFASNDQWAIT